jgi:hypothetical protein
LHALVGLRHFGGNYVARLLDDLAGLPREALLLALSGRIAEAQILDLPQYDDVSLEKLSN